MTGGREHYSDNKRILPLYVHLLSHFPSSTLFSISLYGDLFIILTFTLRFTPVFGSPILSSLLGHRIMDSISHFCKVDMGSLFFGPLGSVLSVYSSVGFIFLGEGLYGALFPPYSQGSIFKLHFIMASSRPDIQSYFCKNIPSKVKLGEKEGPCCARITPILSLFVKSRVCIGKVEKHLLLCGQALFLMGYLSGCFFYFHFLISLLGCIFPFYFHFLAPFWMCGNWVQYYTPSIFTLVFTSWLLGSSFYNGSSICWSIQLGLVSLRLFSESSLQ